jgi:hypothetical protein
MTEQDYTDEAEFWTYSPKSIKEITRITKKALGVRLDDEEGDEQEDRLHLSASKNRLTCIVTRKITDPGKEKEQPLIFWIHHDPNYMTKDMIGRELADRLDTPVHFGMAGVDVDTNETKLRVATTYQPISAQI